MYSNLRINCFHVIFDIRKFNRGHSRNRHKLLSFDKYSFFRATYRHRRLCESIVWFQNRIPGLLRPQYSLSVLTGGPTAKHDRCISALLKIFVQIILYYAAQICFGRQPPWVNLHVISLSNSINFHLFHANQLRVLLSEI